MKIAFFNPLISGRGGVEAVLVNLFSALEKHGDECRLYIFGGSAHGDWLQGIGWHRQIAPPRSRLVRLSRYLLEAIRALRSWKPDAIVACDTTMVRLAVKARSLAGLNDAPVICWIHNPLWEQRIPNAVLDADMNFAICQERADEIKAFADERAKATQIRTVYNGTSLGERPTASRSAKPVFLYVGRVHFEGQKRTSDLVEAAGRLRGDFAIKIAGAGTAEEEQKIKRRAEELGIADRLEWLGWKRDPWSAIGEATVMVQPSAVEGYSMVLIEALSMGIPVAASDFGAIAREALVPGVNGWRFPIADIESLTRILQSIIDHPETVPSPESVRASAARFSTAAMAAEFKAGLEEARSCLSHS